MKLRAIHTTTYLYSAPVSVCHTEARLAPRAVRGQCVLEHDLSIQPDPGQTFPREDYFGNGVTYFSILAPHQTLTVRAASLIETGDYEAPDPRLTPSWEEARAEVRRHGSQHAWEAYEFSLESPRIPVGAEYAAFAAASFAPHRALLEASLDLCHRVFTGFQYDPRATNVRTPVEEVLASRRGVCQDFAHLTIACLRSLGLAARYVSGYLGGEELLGSGASHAWVSVFCPGFGWLDLDPTNDRATDRNYVTLAWGRDYADVAPITGVTVGGGEHFMNVSVEVMAA